MISFLVSRFINQDEKDINTKRYAICKLLGYVGIALNVFLFAAKFTIGHLVGSVAIKGWKRSEFAISIVLLRITASVRALTSTQTYRLKRI